MLLPALLLLGALPAATPSPETAARAQTMLEALRGAGGKSLGHPMFPADLHLDALDQRGETLWVSVSGTFEDRPDEVLDELRREVLLGAVESFGLPGGMVLRIRQADGHYRGLGEGTAPEQPVKAPRSIRSVLGPRTPGKPAPATAALPFGAPLAGRRVALSAGHGWLFRNGAWGTQRDRWDFQGCGQCRGITEDFYNAEMVSRYLLPLLQQMGAEVILVREPDLTVEPAVIVDDGDADYSEQGAWSSGTSDGGYLGDYRANAAADQGVATYRVHVAAPGARHVSVRYREGANRTPAAVLTVEHAGGQEVISLDQRLMGEFWRDLGAFYFLPGQGSVSLSHAPADGYLVADAIKVGGGRFPDADKPFWQMPALTYVAWAGADDSVLQYTDVSIRPAYAEYVGADLYISLHGNASGVTGGSSTHGVSTYRYSCWEESTPLFHLYGDHTSSDGATDCDDPPGSRALLDSVHAAVLEQVRAEWDPNFGNRGKLVADFGEVRTLVDAPGILIESAFFDNILPFGGAAGDPRMQDNKAMHDPRWREAFARGVVAGVARYIGPGTGAPPARPDGLYAVNDVDGSLRVGWRAVDGADGYRLTVAAVDRAWSPGQVVAGTEVRLTDLEPRGIYVFRVSALNGNGEGFPSQAVGVRFRGAVLSTTHAAPALMVYGYDRRDAWVQEMDNDFAYAVEHAHALGAVPDLFFDGALDEVVEDGTLPLDGYRFLDYVAGKDSTADLSVSPGMEVRLRDFVSGGHGLLISGEEIGYHLVGRSQDPADRAFVEEVLGASYVADDAETHTMTGAAGGPFEGVGDVTLDDGTGGVYAVVYPDVVAPVANAKTAMVYPDGTAAAVASEHVIFFGAPLEAVVPAPSRALLFQRAVAYLLPGIAQGDLDGDGAPDVCETANDLNPRDAADGPQDLDGDGRSNAQECQDGTDPRVNENAADAGPPDAAAVADAGTADAARPDASNTDGALPDANHGDASRPDAAPAPDAAALPDASPAADAAAAPDASVPVPDADEGTRTPLERSCGCRATGDGGGGLTVLLVLAGLWRRARRRVNAASPR